MLLMMFFFSLQPSAKANESDEENEEDEVYVKTLAKQSSKGGSKTIFMKNLARGANQDKM